MNRDETKKVILEAIPKQILTLVVGYGINQVGYCFRDGSLESYDHQFYSKQEAIKFEEETIKCGYGNTLCGIVKITIWDQVEASVEEEIKAIENYGEIVTKEDVENTARNRAKYELQELTERF